MTGRQLIAHLLRRAGFGATPAELDQYHTLGFDAAVTRLLSYQSVDATAFEASLTAQNYNLSRIDGCQNWWIYRMLHTPRPLEEKMTLFWHGHFASTNAKVERPPYMLIQNRLFRENALGDFKQLVLKVTQDPAMLVFLDGRENGRRRPNENYARELMELFTLGIGNYTEADIRDAARALTGWTIREDRFFVNTGNHDTGTKTVLGQTGPFDGTDICRIVCEQTACPPFIARKLIRFFVYDNPTDEYVGRMAAVFRSAGLGIRALVEAILRSPEFKSDAAYRATIKSPAEYVVGTMKALEVAVLPTDFRGLMRSMQQELFNPPGVEGWDGATAWLSTTTFLHRTNFINRLTSGTFGGQPFFRAVTQGTNEQTADHYAGRLLQGDITADGRAALIEWLRPITTRSKTRRMRGLIHLILTSPKHQLN